MMGLCIVGPMGSWVQWGLWVDGSGFDRIVVPMGSWVVEVMDLVVDVDGGGGWMWMEVFVFWLWFVVMIGGCG